MSKTNKMLQLNNLILENDQAISKSRAPWSCGLICFVLDLEVKGLNLDPTSYHQFLRRWEVEAFFEASISCVLFFRIYVWWLFVEKLCVLDYFL